MYFRRFAQTDFSRVCQQRKGNVLLNQHMGTALFIVCGIFGCFNEDIRQENLKPGKERAMK
jgi:hypothetical protein